MILPLKLEVESTEQPIANYVLIVITCLVFFLSLFEPVAKVFYSTERSGFNFIGIIGGVFLHKSFFSLVFNMFFLFVYGSAVCSVLGNMKFFILYIFLGVMVSVINLLAGHTTALGANGAINGLMGLALVWFPKNEMTFFYFFTTIRVKIIYGILFYIVLGLLGIFLFGGSNLSQFARFGGLVSGIAIGLILDKYKFVSIYETTLIDMITKNEKQKKIITKNYYELLDKANEIDLEGELSRINFTPSYLPEESMSQKVNVEDIHEAVPKFRILRTVKTDKETKFFIVNEGDTITQISAKSSNGITCKIFPKEEFKANDTGVLSLLSLNFSEDKITIFITYNNSQKTVQTEFTYYPALNKMLT